MQALLTTITVFYHPVYCQSLKGREACNVFSLHMHTYWISLISTLIPTLNVPIYKFKYQSMIIMQIIIWRWYERRCDTT